MGYSSANAWPKADFPLNPKLMWCIPLRVPSHDKKHYRSETGDVYLSPVKTQPGVFHLVTSEILKLWLKLGMMFPQLPYSLSGSPLSMQGMHLSLDCSYSWINSSGLLTKGGSAFPKQFSPQMVYGEPGAFLLSSSSSAAPRSAPSFRHIQRRFKNAAKTDLHSPDWSKYTTVWV